VEDGSFPEQDPRPDEDAWEAYLEFVRPFLDARDDTGLENSQLRTLEELVGAPLPFEVGLLLVMGVPDTFPWRNWNTDPEAQLTEWNAELGTALGLDAQDLLDAPRLFPLYANVAVPLVADQGETPGVTAPVFRVDPGSLQLAGLDLADWLHKQFDVPLPWWPDNQPQTVPFWSDRLG